MRTVVFIHVKCMFKINSSLHHKRKQVVVLRRQQNFEDNSRVQEPFIQLKQKLTQDSIVKFCPFTHTCKHAVYIIFILRTYFVGNSKFPSSNSKLSVFDLAQERPRQDELTTIHSQIQTNTPSNKTIARNVLYRRRQARIILMAHIMFSPH